jgi:predicted permease
MGWLAARFDILKQETGNGIADFVFVVAIPLMLFRTLATAPLPGAPPWSYWASYFIALGLIWAGASLICRRGFARSGQEAAIVGFTAAQSNMVLLGIPLILRVFGEEGNVPLFLLIAIHLPITMTAATILIERAEPGESKVKTILTRMLRNPVVMAIVAGGLFRLTGLELAGPISSTMKFLGDAAAPCALFATGMALRRYGIGGDTALLSIVAFLKLLVHPLLVFVLARYVFSVPPLWVGVATVLAGCPTGVNAYLLAERYRLATGLTSGAVLLTTLAAALTTTLLVWLVLP